MAKFKFSSHGSVILYIIIFILQKLIPFGHINITSVTAFSALSSSSSSLSSSSFKIIANIRNSNNRKNNNNMTMSCRNNNKIFCFGDSLTAGTSPPSLQNYPYALHLESTLNRAKNNNDNKGSSQSDQVENYIVRHVGMPGWTATQLSSIDGNLHSILDRIRSSTDTYPAIVIILAGTNDLAYCSNEDQCNNIFQAIKNIHTICHEKKIDTLALTIPPSAWQCQSNNDSSLYAKRINEMMKQWIREMEVEKSSGAVAHFATFPIESYDSSSGFWSPDGLHFSPKGYEFIGEALAPTVQRILDSKN